MKFKIQYNNISLFLFTIAVFVGEATLETIKIPVSIHSSVMYMLMLAGAAFGVTQIKIYKNISPVFILYVYILIRNISLDSYKIETYWLPNFFTLILFIILYGYIIKNKKNLYLIKKYIYWFLSVLMIIGSIKAALSRERLAVFGGPNGYYKFAMFFAAISLVEYMFEKKSRYLFFAVVGVVLSFLTGSKGALISICVLFPIMYWYYMVKNNTSSVRMVRNLLILFLITVVIAVAGIIAINKIPYFKTLFDREIAVFSSDAKNLTSVSARTGALSLSWQYFLDSPIFGKGAYYMMYSTALSETPMPYAHNVFFELLGEQGIIGFVLLLIIIFRLLRYMKKRYLIKNKYYAELYLGFLVYFIGSQFSGNILDSKVFLFFALLIMTMYKNKFLEDAEDMKVISENTSEESENSKMGTLDKGI